MSVDFNIDKQEKQEKRSWKNKKKLTYIHNHCRKSKNKITLITWLLRSQPIWVLIIFEVEVSQYGSIVFFKLHISMHHTLSESCQIDLQDSIH